MALPSTEISLPNDLDIADVSIESLRQAAVDKSSNPPKRNWPLIQQGLNFWKRNLPSTWRLSIRADGVVSVPHSVGGEQSLPALGVLEVGGLCEEMQNCKNFQTVVKSLRAHDEFVTTLFTIQAAHLCFAQPTTTGLEFSPQIAARAGLKRPDFAFVSPVGRVICECKDMQSVARLKKFPDMRVLRAFEAAIRAVEIPSDLRPEIKFASRPNHSIELFAEQIAAALQELGKRRSPRQVVLNYREVSRSVTICLTERDRPPRLTGGRNLITLLSPTTAFAENLRVAPVLLVVDKEDATSIGQHIRNANQQLPNIGPTLIFIKPTHGPSTFQAVERRLAKPEYLNLVAVVFQKESTWEVLGSTNHAATLRMILPRGDSARA